jgi:predicted MFS family arabinose efflux permease
MQIQSDGDVEASNAMPTLEDQLNSVGLGRLQWVVVFAAGVMVLGDGMEIAAVSMLERPLAREWGVSSDDLALVGSILFAGTIVGALWGGWCSDQFGRKWTLSSFGLLFVFGGICAVASRSFAVFATARFVGLPVFFFVLGRQRYDTNSSR